MSASQERTSFVVRTWKDQSLDNEALLLLPDGCSRKEVEEFPAYRNWLTRLLHNLDLQQNPAHTFHQKPYRLREIDVQAIIRFGHGNIGFIQVQSKVETDPYDYVDETTKETKVKTDELPGCVFMRGGSVAVLVRCLSHKFLVQCSDTVVVHCPSLRLRKP
jgi:ADP-sugar diphosphatase